MGQNWSCLDVGWVAIFVRRERIPICVCKGLGLIIGRLHIGAVSLH